MSVWLIRAGAHGEYEQKFILDQRVYVTWDNSAALFVNCDTHRGCPIESFWMIGLCGFGGRDSVRQRRQSHPQRRGIRAYAFVKRKHRQLAKRFVEHECRCEVQGIERAYGFNRKLCSRASENAFGEIVHIPARFRPVQYLQGGQFVCSRDAMRGARAG